METNLKEILDYLKDKGVSSIVIHIGEGKVDDGKEVQDRSSSDKDG